MDNRYYQPPGAARRSPHPNDARSTPSPTAGGASHPAFRQPGGSSRPRPSQLQQEQQQRAEEFAARLAVDNTINGGPPYLFESRYPSPAGQQPGAAGRAASGGAGPSRGPEPTGTGRDAAYGARAPPRMPGRGPSPTSPQQDPYSPQQQQYHPPPPRHYQQQQNQPPQHWHQQQQGSAIPPHHDRSRGHGPQQQQHQQQQYGYRDYHGSHSQQHNPQYGYGYEEYGGYDYGYDEYGYEYGYGHHEGGGYDYQQQQQHPQAGHPPSNNAYAQQQPAPAQQQPPPPAPPPQTEGPKRYSYNDEDPYYHASSYGGRHANGNNNAANNNSNNNNNIYRPGGPTNTSNAHLPPLTTTPSPAPPGAAGPGPGPTIRYARPISPTSPVSATSTHSRLSSLSTSTTHTAGGGYPTTTTATPSALPPFPGAAGPSPQQQQQQQQQQQNARQTPLRVPLGPPPSARRGPAHYYPPLLAGGVHPIVEEQQAMVEHGGAAAAAGRAMGVTVVEEGGRDDEAGVVRRRGLSAAGERAEAPPASVALSSSSPPPRTTTTATATAAPPPPTAPPGTSSAASPRLPKVSALLSASTISLPATAATAETSSSSGESTTGSSGNGSGNGNGNHNPRIVSTASSNLLPVGMAPVPAGAVGSSTAPAGTSSVLAKPVGPPAASPATNAPAVPAAAFAATSLTSATAPVVSATATTTAATAPSTQGIQHHYRKSLPYLASSSSSLYPEDELVDLPNLSAVVTAPGWIPGDLGGSENVSVPTPAPAVVEKKAVPQISRKEEETREEISALPSRPTERRAVPQIRKDEPSISALPARPAEQPPKAPTPHDYNKPLPTKVQRPGQIESLKPLPMSGTGPGMFIPAAAAGNGTAGSSGASSPSQQSLRGGVSVRPRLVEVGSETSSGRNVVLPTAGGPAGTPASGATPRRSLDGTASSEATGASPKPAPAAVATAAANPTSPTTSPGASARKKPSALRNAWRREAQKKAAGATDRETARRSGLSSDTEGGVLSPTRTLTDGNVTEPETPGVPATAVVVGRGQDIEISSEEDWSSSGDEQLMGKGYLASSPSQSAGKSSSNMVALLNQRRSKERRRSKAAVRNKAVFAAAAATTAATIPAVAAAAERKEMGWNSSGRGPAVPQKPQAAVPVVSPPAHPPAAYTESRDMEQRDPISPISPVSPQQASTLRSPPPGFSARPNERGAITGGNGRRPMPPRIDVATAPIAAGTVAGTAGTAGAAGIPRKPLGEVRSSTTSLTDLIQRATRLASNLDRGRTASRLVLPTSAAAGSAQAQEKSKGGATGRLRELTAEEAADETTIRASQRGARKSKRFSTMMAAFPSPRLDGAFDPLPKLKQKPQPSAQYLGVEDYGDGGKRWPAAGGDARRDTQETSWPSPKGLGAVQSPPPGYRRVDPHPSSRTKEFEVDDEKGHVRRGGGGGGDGTRRKQSQDKKNPRRYCCGLPLWVFSLVLVGVIVLVALAVILPIVLVVIPNQQKASAAATSQSSSSTQQCTNPLSCANGGANIGSNWSNSSSVAATSGSCVCLCVNGWSGAQCTTPPTASADCFTTSLSNGMNATIGTSVPVVVQAAVPVTGIPLKTDRLVQVFSQVSLSCQGQNALLQFNNVGGSSSSSGATTTAAALSARATGDSTGTATSNGIIYFTVTAAPPTTTLMPVSTPTPSTGSSPFANNPPLLLLFARAATLYVLQNTTSLNTAVGAQLALQGWFDGKAASSSTSSAGTVDLGSGWRAAVGDLALWDPYGKLVGKA